MVGDWAPPSQPLGTQIWALLKFYQDRLHPELDVRYRLSSQFGSKGL